jgi:diamine N-acetyltransferase
MMSEAKLTLITATCDDINRLCAICRRTYAAHYSGIWTDDGLLTYLDDQYDASKVQAEISGGKTEYLLAAVDGHDVGFAKLNYDRPLPTDPEKLGVELQKIYFDADQTGKGYGSISLQRITNIARESGSERIWLDVLKSNEGGRRAYERAGFSVVGEESFATDIEPIGMWVMEKILA